MEQLLNIKQIINDSSIDKEYIFYAMVYRPIKKFSSTGKPFMDCSLRDKENFISAKKWSIDKIDEQHLRHGNVLKIIAKTNFFNGSLQLIIISTEIIIDEEVKLYILPSAPVSIEKMWEEFNVFLNKIIDKDYKKIIDTVFTNEIIQKFKTTRAGLSFHHDVVGGLLWHTLSILKSAEKISEVYKELKINKSLLYTGIIFHDIGKIYEIGDFLQESYSLYGTLVGHISIGSSIVYKTGIDLNISKAKIIKLQHLILSSHGKLENASPILPRLIESVILSKLDDLDAKLNSIYKATKDVKNGEFSSPIKTMNNTKIFVTYEEDIKK